MKSRTLVFTQVKALSNKNKFKYTAHQHSTNTEIKNFFVKRDNLKLSIYK